MITRNILFVVALLLSTSLSAQQLRSGSGSIYQIPKALLAGEGLDSIPQRDPTRTVFQKKVYDGQDIAIFMVAIGTGITNEFEGFPLEEFIFWMNGKAVVEPIGEEPFAVQTGDYFLQAKGFTGKWNFIDIGDVHLELALIAKNRPGPEVKSPITRAKVLDRDMISGVTKPEDGVVYRGAEIDVNLINEPGALSKVTKERMLHVLNGVLTMNGPEGEKQFYPGDFFVVPEGYKATWSCNSLQELRVLEVYKAH